jgi:hypothetical protein
MQIPKWLTRIKDTWSWGRFAWQIAAAFGLTGLVGSVAGAVWAVILGVPLPIALMVGYCTLIGAVYLAMAPLAFRVLATSGAVRVEKKFLKPNYDAVRLMHEYTLRDASRLWCDIDQNDKATHESESWYQALRAAVQRGEISFKPRITSQGFSEKKNPEGATINARQALQKYAVKIKKDPIFLRD